MTNAVKIGERLRKLRSDIPREKVALDNGISVSALAMYELGQRIPRDEIKLSLAHYYNTSVGELFYSN